MESVAYYNDLMSDPAYHVRCAWGGGERGRYMEASQGIAADEEVVCEMPVIAWPHPAAVGGVCPVCLQVPGADGCAGAACGEGGWVQYMDASGIARAREWQMRKDKGAVVTLEALGRAVAHIAMAFQRCAAAGLPETEAVDHAFAPFSRLAQPDGVMGEWTEEYHAALPGILCADAIPVALRTASFDLLSLASVNVLIGGIALNAVTITLPSGGAGSGVYTLTANINHSCSPTARVEMDGTSLDINVKALRPLSGGEEITISYVPITLALAERRKRLKKYDFECKCDRCVRESGVPPRAAGVPAGKPAQQS